MVSTFDVSGWKSKVEAAGFRVSAHGCIVTLSRTFAPGDHSAFVDCDMFAEGYLLELPQTQPGSTWGTDGGSVGGYFAVQSGNFRLNRSGISKRVIAKLARA
jgi:hypothetical protein